VATPGTLTPVEYRALVADLVNYLIGRKNLQAPGDAGAQPQATKPVADLTPEQRELLSAAYNALPPRAKSWLAGGIIGVIVALSSQLLAIWGLPDRFAALETKLATLDTKIDKLIGKESAATEAYDLTLIMIFSWNFSHTINCSREEVPAFT
jgi:hypothetical protein